MDKKQMTRNKICFGLGTVGRDALYTLISMYLINYLTGVVGMSDGGLLIVGTILMILGVFDAVIDPFMGILVDNTNTKFGRYKPWIFAGMIGTGLLTIAMFHNIRLEETTHIIVLTIIYLLFSFAFTANDLSYWSLMPAITKDQKDRESIGAFARICANVGMFAMVLIFPNVPSMFAFTGLKNRDIYYIFAIITVVVMWAFQLITLIGVKENKDNYEKKEHTNLRGMFKALLENDQLMVIAVAMALFMVGYSVTTSFGVYYFRYAFKDDGLYMIFCVVLAVAQLTALSTFPLFRKKFTRKQLYTGSMIAVVASYLLFFLSFEVFPLVIVAGLGLFFGQAFIQLLMLLFLADAIEYGEWKLGKRNEAVSFAVQPFINQFGSAISKLTVTATLVISAINPIEDAIKDLAENSPERADLINSVGDGSVWIMKIAMMILPLVLILIGFILYMKKFKIDENFYEQILSDLAARKASKKNSKKKKKKAARK